MFGLFCCDGDRRNGGGYLDEEDISGTASSRRKSVVVGCKGPEGKWQLKDGEERTLQLPEPGG